MFNVEHALGACYVCLLLPSGAHEKDMFVLIADSVIEAMSVVFEMTRDEAALEKTLQV